MQMLIVAAGVVVLAVALEVRPEQRVAFRGLADYPLPETCMARGIFATPCPGCGLTRSIIHLTRSDWRASVATHRLGWLLAAAILFQFPYRLLALAYGDPPRPFLFLCRCFGHVLIFLLLANWILTLLGGWVGG